jgi:hypothetical protein
MAASDDQFLDIKSSLHDDLLAVQPSFIGNGTAVYLLIQEQRHPLHQEASIFINREQAIQVRDTLTRIIEASK